MTCPFCDLIENLDPAVANAAAVSVPDAFPLSPGHTLVIPRKHIKSIYELTELEQDALWSLVRAVRAMLKDEHRPDGFNIGLNDGKAAGQTIRHAHVHVIPRYRGDVDDPRGGIRWVIPERAPYWND